MKCLSDDTRGAELLVGYLEGTLDQAARAELEAHAAECAECRGLLAVQTELDGYVAPAVAADFDERLYARIAREERMEPAAGMLGAGSFVAKVGAGWRALVGGMAMRPMVPVAVVLAAVAVGLIVGPMGQPFAGGREGAEIVDDGAKMAKALPADGDIEQLEQILNDLELLMPLGSDEL